jgi:hypothetical protein
MALIATPYFILYSRSYCYLCDDMLQPLLALHGRISRVLIDLTVDVNPALLVCYDEMVPLLVTRRGCALLLFHGTGTGQVVFGRVTRL